MVGRDTIYYVCGITTKKDGIGDIMMGWSWMIAYKMIMFGVKYCENITHVIGLVMGWLHLVAGDTKPRHGLRIESSVCEPVVQQ